MKKFSATVRNILILICFIVVAVVLYFLRGVVAPFLVALVIAYVLNPAVRFIESKNIARNWAVIIVFALGFGATVLFVVPFVYSMVTQATEMSTKLEGLTKTKLSEQYSMWEGKTKERLKELFPEHKDNLSELLQNSKLQEYIAEGVVIAKDGLIKLSYGIFGFLGNTFTGVFNFVFVPMLVFYILLDMEELFKGFKKLIPPDYRVRTLSILNKIDKQLGSMLRGQCIQNLIFAVLMTIGFAISGLKACLFLGPISGLANFIPYLGGFFSIIVAFFAAITQFGESGPWLWIGIITTVSVVQFIDCWYMQPYIVGGNVGLQPLTIMLALTIAGSLGGITGMLLAVPVTIILKVLAIELYDELYDQEPVKDE